MLSALSLLGHKTLHRETVVFQFVVEEKIRQHHIVGLRLALGTELTV